MPRRSATCASCRQCAAVGQRVGGSYRFQDEHGVWWLSYAVPAVNGWSAISFQQEDEVLAAVRETTALAVLVTAIVIALKIGFTWAVTRRIVRPIRDLTATAIEIADGNWKRRIPQDRHNELGALAKAFNRMVDQLEASNSRRWTRRSFNLRRPLPRANGRRTTHHVFVGRPTKPRLGGDYQPARHDRIRQSKVHRSHGLYGRRGRRA